VRPIRSDSSVLRVRLEPLLRVRWRRLRRRAEASRAEASAMAADAAEDSLLMAACYLNGRVLSVAAPAPTDHGCAQGVPTFAAPPCVMLVIIAAPRLAAPRLTRCYIIYNSSPASS